MMLRADGALVSVERGQKYFHKKNLITFFPQTHGNVYAKYFPSEADQLKASSMQMIKK